MDTKLANRQKATGKCGRGDISMDCGVPQISVPGPLLCLVYIDDLEDGVASNILKFADDTNIFRRGWHDIIIFMATVLVMLC